MAEDLDFATLVDRLRARDPEAAAQVHQRFVRRLVLLACAQLQPWARARADRGPEDVVQSVFRTFFARCERGEFDLGHWGALWGLLVVITFRKCHLREDYLRAGRRDVGREVARPMGPGGELGVWEALAREPSPEQAAVLAETVERWMFELRPAEREVVDLALRGESSPGIALLLGRSERTVRRVLRRAEDRLGELTAVEAS